MAGFLLLLRSLFFSQEFISMLPNVDHPEAFGQHPNADIASQIIETKYVALPLVCFCVSFQQCPVFMSRGTVMCEE